LSAASSWFAIAIAVSVEWSDWNCWGRGGVYTAGGAGVLTDNQLPVARYPEMAKSFGTLLVDKSDRITKSWKIRKK